MKNNFYITTTLPYLNDNPHLGHALEFIQADVIARYKRATGHNVVFNTGTDEHGLKIYQKAFENKLPPKDYVDLYALRFKALKEKLNLSFSHFIRTTDPHHMFAAQEFWKRCDAAGDIYKGEYEVKYCVGCELEKNETELENGRCFIHPNLEISLIHEENYFFRWSKYQDKLLALYEQSDFVVPNFRLKEIKTFVSSGLKDFSISRIKEKMPWGIPVPGDDRHVMYVWFDALVNYISTLGWPGREEEFENFWPGVQVAGKDNLRQQSAMWQAMLFSAGVKPSKQIFIHGFINSGGQKMSKSLGNVIDPLVVAEDFSIDALRYFLLREIPSYEDGDFTMDRFREAYNANLANGLGNLVSRVMRMSEQYLETYDSKLITNDEFPEEMKNALEKFQFDRAMDIIWRKVQEIDRKIQETEPFKLIKTDEARAKEILRELVIGVYEIGTWLAPFLPHTSEIILAAVHANKKPENLFVRK